MIILKFEVSEVAKNVLYLCTTIPLIDTRLYKHNHTETLLCNAYKQMEIQKLTRQNQHDNLLVWRFLLLQLILNTIHWRFSEVLSIIQAWVLVGRWLRYFNPSFWTYYIKLIFDSLLLGLGFKCTKI